MILSIKQIVQGSETAVIIKNDSRCEIKGSKSRIIRTKTLDLGTVIDNQGYAAGDRTLRIIALVPEADEQKIWDLHKNNLFLLVSTRDGRFYGAIEDLKVDRGQIEMTFLIKEQDL